MRYYIIVNPAAGRGRGALALQAVERTFRDAGVSCRLLETRGPGHAVELARDARLAGNDVVVAVGGDGTVHEVVHGLVEASRSDGGWEQGRAAGTLAIVPVGTGNDYAARLGIPQNDPKAAAHIVLAGAKRVVDLGHVTDDRGRSRFFHNHLGGGFEAAAAIESSKLSRLSGLLLYLFAVLRVIPQYSKGREVRIHWNGREEKRRVLVASVANGGFSGGGFKIAPAARLDDGLLDVVLADSPNVGIILWLLPHFMRGTHVRQTRYVATSQTEGLVIEAPSGIPVHLDGEIFSRDARRLEIAVFPARLEVIGPAS